MENQHELDKKTCKDCQFNTAGICDTYGILNHDIDSADCKEFELRVKGN